MITVRQSARHAVAVTNISARKCCTQDNIDVCLFVAVRSTFTHAGTAFAAEWDQLYFLDPEGTVVEVHQVVAENYKGL